MDNAPLGTDTWAAEIDTPRARSASRARARLEEQISPWLSPECSNRLWSEAWDLARVTPSSLWAWSQRYGAELAALAVAAGITEAEIRCHIKDHRRPDRGALEMLADLNCFPYVTPAARPLVAA